MHYPWLRVSCGHASATETRRKAQHRCAALIQKREAVGGKSVKSRALTPKNADGLALYDYGGKFIHIGAGVAEASSELVDVVFVGRDVVSIIGSELTLVKNPATYEPFITSIEVTIPEVLKIQPQVYATIAPREIRDFGNLMFNLASWGIEILPDICEEYKSK